MSLDFINDLTNKTTNKDSIIDFIIDTGFLILFFIVQFSVEDVNNAISIFTKLIFSAIAVVRLLILIKKYKRKYNGTKKEEK